MKSPTCNCIPRIIPCAPLDCAHEVPSEGRPESDAQVSGHWKLSFMNQVTKESQKWPCSLGEWVVYSTPKAEEATEMHKERTHLHH